MHFNSRISKIAASVTVSRIQALHKSVMGFYTGALEATGGLLSCNKESIRTGLSIMKKFSGISVKMLTMTSIFENLLSGNCDKQRACIVLKQAFKVLLPDMQRTYEYYGDACEPAKNSFEKMARALDAELKRLK